MFGDLSQVSLPTILRLLDHTQKTGLLSIWGESGVYRLFFESGALVAAASPQEKERFATFLHLSGGLKATQIQPLLETVPDQMPFGTMLKQQQLVSAQALEQAFEQQLRTCCYPLFLLTSGRFRLTEEALFPSEEMTGLKRSAIQVALQGMRIVTACPDFYVRLPQADCLLRRVDRQLPEADFSDIERQVWQHLATERRLKDVSRCILASLLEVRQAVFHLQSLQVIEAVSSAAAVLSA